MIEKRKAKTKFVGPVVAFGCLNVLREFNSSTIFYILFCVQSESLWRVELIQEMIASQDWK